ncbi:MAG: hypothetical protein K8I60_08850 [Anaerolineae bacterium]|nr:hypothetical protein [Anaerolineae bacterium]
MDSAADLIPQTGASDEPDGMVDDAPARSRFSVEMGIGLLVLVSIVGILGYAVVVGLTADRSQLAVPGRAVDEQFASNDGTVSLVMFEADW